jgi:hypothetical protein
MLDNPGSAPKLLISRRTPITSISIPGSSANLRGGPIDEPAQRPSEVVHHRVA